MKLTGYEEVVIKADSQAWGGGKEKGRDFTLVFFLIPIDLSKFTVV